MLLAEVEEAYEHSESPVRGLKSWSNPVSLSRMRVSRSERNHSFYKARTLNALASHDLARQQCDHNRSSQLRMRSPLYVPLRQTITFG